MHCFIDLNQFRCIKPRSKAILSVSSSKRSIKINMPKAKLYLLLAVCCFLNSVHSEDNGYAGDGNEKLKFYSQSLSYINAEAKCNEDRAFLAYWNTSQQKSQIEKIVGRRNIWIGITLHYNEVSTSNGMAVNDFESLYGVDLNDFSVDSYDEFKDRWPLCMQDESTVSRDCGSLNAFVCKKLVTNNKPFFRKDYKYDKTHNYFYKKVHPMTWHQANDFCENEGSKMATISHRYGVETLTSLLFPGEQLWIAANDLLMENDFQDTNGEDLVENFNKTNGHCVIIDDKGSYSAIDCKTTDISFVCQKMYESMNYDCDTVDDGYSRLESGNKCVKYHSIPKNWHEALRTCKIENATLFIINNEREANVLNAAFNLIKTSHDMFYHYDRSIFHIGFHDLFTNGIYKTVDDFVTNDPGFAFRHLQAFKRTDELELTLSKWMFRVYILNKCITESKAIAGEKVYSLKDDGYIREGNDYLKFYSDERHFYDAKAQCYEDGAYLAYWNSLLQKSQIQKMIGRQTIWIGIKFTNGAVYTSNGVALENFDSLYSFDMHEEIRYINNPLCLNYGSIEASNCPALNAFVCVKKATQIKSDPFFRNDYKYDKKYNYFYKKVHPMTWHQANGFCENEGSKMATINHRYDTESLTSLLSPGEQLWIGATDLLMENDFEDTNGEVLDGKLYKTNGHCVTIDDKGLYSAIECKTTNISFVCQKTYESFNFACDTVDDGYSIMESSDKCVKYHIIPKNWHEALRTCKIENAKLFIINNETEANVLNDAFHLIKTPHKMLYHYDRSIFHVGFHDLFTNGIYKTVDGTYLNNAGYLKWSTHYPKPFIGLRCGGMVEGGTLQNGGCNVLAMFVCQKKVTS